VAKLGAPHPQSIRAAGRLAVTLAMAGRADEAKAIAKDLVATARQGLPADDLRTATALGEAGLAYLLAGAPADAEPLIRESLGLWEKKEPASFQTPLARSLLGGCLTKLGRPADAGPLLLAGYEGLKAQEAKLLPIDRRSVPEAIDRLVEHFTATGKPDDAKRWQAERAKYPPAK
jgi:hypothetical protein